MDQTARGQYRVVCGACRDVFFSEKRKGKKKKSWSGGSRSKSIKIDNRRLKTDPATGRQQ